MAGCTNVRKMNEIINGVSVHYVIDGDGEKVLLLHGWGCDISLMQPVSEALRTDCKVMMIDFPGHGKSGRPPEPWGVPEYADCLAALLKKVSFFPCTVIAHSFGCRVAAWLEAYQPFLFSRIVFTGAAGIRPKPTAESQKRSQKYQRLKGYTELIQKIPFLRSSAPFLQEKLRQRYGSRDYNALDEEMRKTFIKVIQQDLTECYDKFCASTLLIWGDADTETPLWMAREMEKRIPDCGLVIFEGCSHFAYLEQINRFNMIIKRFLQEDEKR